jgi:type IV secretory pathway VirB4 component
LRYPGERGGVGGGTLPPPPPHNQVILARSGAGKSYLAKLEALRWLYQGVQVLIIDPEAEYQRLADAVGGTTLRLGAPGVHRGASRSRTSWPTCLAF